MEFPFPPAPPGYTDVLIARWLLAGWTATGMGLLITRLRRWKFVRSREMLVWGAAAGISWVVVGAGSCRYTAYDDNRWLTPLAAAAFSVSAAGITIGLAKIYAEGSDKERLYAGAFIGTSTLVLGYLLLPSLGHHGEASNRTHCKNNLKQLGLALHNYHDINKTFPPSSNGDVPVSWRISILPQLDQQQLSVEYDRKRAWDDVANTKFARQKVDPMVCPSIYGSRQDAGLRWFTAYSMLTGPHTVGDKSVKTSFKDITDGTSNTLFTVEACGALIVWTEPRDVDTTRQPVGINLKGKQLGASEGWMSSYHYGGAQALLADGTVRFLSGNIDPNLLKKLSTIDGNELLKPDEMP